MTKRPAPTLAGPLAGLAQRVRDKARQLHTLRTDAHQLQELKNRKERLRELADRSVSLASTARILRNAGRPFVVPAAVVTAALQEIAESQQRGPGRVTKIEEALRQVELALKGAWQAPIPDLESARSIATLVERFPQLKGAGVRIQDAADRLAKSLDTLPTTPTHAQTAARLLNALNAEVLRLQEQGLDADVQRFLGQSAAGVTLEALLEAPEILKFLREHQLLSSFTVKLRTQVP